MEYKEPKHLHFLKRKIYTRYAGWQGCINILPYLVIRRNPLRTDWVDFSVECGWLLWVAGVRVEPEK